MRCFSIAASVPCTRGSSGGRKPTRGIWRALASRFLLPKYWTKEFSSRLKPSRHTSSWISERSFFQVPGVFLLSHSFFSGEVEGIEDFTKDIELELGTGGVANAHGARALIAGKLVQFKFGEPALARHSVHDLHLFGVAGHGP